MPTWKKILTEDSPAPNLGNSDLTTPVPSGSTSNRLFTLSPATLTSNLQFRGTVNGNVRTFLRIETDSDSDQISQNYVYVNSLRIGNFGLSSNTNERGYSLPQHSNVGTGKIITSTGAWADNYGQTSFVSFDDWMDPDFPSNHGFGTTGNFNPKDSVYTGSGSDKVLVYDDSASTYKPCSLKNLQGVLGNMYVFNFSNTTQYSLQGSPGSEITPYLGANFGAPGTGNGDGYVVLEDNTFIVGISFRTFVTGFYNRTIKPRIFINGNNNWTQIYDGVSYDHADDTYSGGDINSNFTNSGHSVKNQHVFDPPIPVNAGDEIFAALIYQAVSTSCTTCKAENQLMTVYLKTFNSNITRPMLE